MKNSSSDEETSTDEEDANALEPMVDDDEDKKALLSFVEEVQTSRTSIEILTTVKQPVVPEKCDWQNDPWEVMQVCADGNCLYRFVLIVFTFVDYLHYLF